jgi:CubicO group peptidase (beta-lactamase class C family)
MSDRFAPVVRLLDAMVAQGQVPGAAIAVAVGPHRVFEHYAGESSAGIVADAGTIWAIASISKLYTAAVIGRLLEMGEIVLSRRVQTILPDFTADGRDRITIRQLLVHMSGLDYESPRMAEMMAAQTPLAEIIDECYTCPMNFEPGTQQAYSDRGYAIAGRVAEVVTGKPFATLVEELVLQPAGLTDTYVRVPTELFPRVAYVPGVLAEGTDGAMYNSAYGRNFPHPALGTFATVRDLLNFGLLYAPSGTKRIHTPAGLRAMITDQTGGDFPGEFLIRRKPDGIVHPWGIGWMFKGFAGTPDFVSPGSYGHGGASGCILWIDPALDLTVAFVSNRHLNLSLDDWIFRIDRVLNVTVAAASMPA